MAQLTLDQFDLLPLALRVLMDPQALTHIAGDVSAPPFILPPGIGAIPLLSWPEDYVCPLWTPTASLPSLPVVSLH